MGIQPFTAWGVKEICCANLFFVPRCSPSPNRNQPTCLSWGPSVSCAKLEVCPAQIKTTSHLDVRTMAHAENVDGWCQRSFPCKLPLGRQESQCLLYPVPVWWRGKAARHEPQPCRFGLRPTQVSLWSVFSLVHGRLCTLRYLKLSDLLELPWVFCLFLEEKAEGHTRKKNVPGTGKSRSVFVKPCLQDLPLKTRGFQRQITSDCGDYGHPMLRDP